MKDDNDFNLIGKGEKIEFLGYNSASDKTSTPAGFMVRGSKNVYKKPSGTIASRPGLKRRGSVDSTDAGVKSSFEWLTNVGTERVLRVCNNKLQVESNIADPNVYVWYDLLETSTLASPAATLTRFVFDTWWDTDEATDRLLMVRGDDKILHWSGGIAIVSAGSVGIVGGINGINVATQGTGYEVDDILTITGGGGTGGQVRVTGVTGGAVTAIDLENPGAGYSVTAAAASTGGQGTGFELQITSVVTTYSITKQGSENWAELGFATNIAAEKKIIIDGVEYQYSGGEDTTTLTGVTTDTSSLVSGQIAIQSVLTADFITDNDDEIDESFTVDFIKVIQNQAFVGSYSFRTVYVSANINTVTTLGFANFTNTGSLVAGDPLSFTLDSLPKGIGEKDGKVIMFGGISDLYVVTPNTNLPVSVNNEYIEQKVEKKVLPGLSAALGHEFISNFSNDLVWVDQNNQLRALGTFANVSDIKPVTLSLAVQEELKEDDFTGGHVRAIDDTIYITAPNNGRDWMYQVREVLNESGQIVSERLWHPPQIRGISRFALISGVIHGHSNANPQVYQVWDTLQWYDDDPNQEEIPYSCVAKFPYLHYGRRQGLETFDKIYFEGYMPEGVILNCVIDSDYQGSTASLEVNINGGLKTAQFFSGSVYPSFGDSEFGDNPFGDGILPEASEQELVPKFRAIRDAKPKNFFEYALTVYSQAPNSRWELLCLGTNVRLAAQTPNFIRKTN